MVSYFFKLYFSECDKLPISWSGVTTDVTFPVTRGTVVTVRCATGYTKTGGDVVVTCDRDTVYTYTSVLSCKSGTFNFIV